MTMVNKFALVSALALLAACGGGGGGSDNQDVTVAFPIDLPFTTTITGVTTPTPTGTSLVDTSMLGGTVYVGRWNNEDARGFLSFALSPLPAGAVVVSATVEVSGRVKSGTPYSTFAGSPTITWVDMGAAPSFDDFGNVFGSFLNILPTWSSAPFQPGLVGGSALTAAVSADLQANRPRSSFRLRFNGTTSVVGLDEGVEIQVSQVDPSLRPVLVVTYRP